MKRMLFALLLLPAIGHAQDTAPVCSCPAQCDAMWAQATQDIEPASGMRIRIATNTLLETYVTNNAGRLTGTVTKRPVGNGSYAIELTLQPWYRGQADVQAGIRQHIGKFNADLAQAGATTTCP